MTATEKLRKRFQNTTQELFTVKEHIVIHEIVDNNNLNKLQLLMPAIVSQNYDINHQDADWGKRTPLHIASYRGYLKCCEKLLENGASLHLLMSNGYTPSHCAAERGRLEVLKLLKKHGDNFRQCDNVGDLPLDVAKRYGHKECEEFLLNSSNS